MFAVLAKVNEAKATTMLNYSNEGERPLRSVPVRREGAQTVRSCSMVWAAGWGSRGWWDRAGEEDTQPAAGGGWWPAAPIVSTCCCWGVREGTCWSSARAASGLVGSKPASRLRRRRLCVARRCESVQAAVAWYPEACAVTSAGNGGGDRRWRGIAYRFMCCRSCMLGDRSRACCPYAQIACGLSRTPEP